MLEVTSTLLAVAILYSLWKIVDQRNTPKVNTQAVEQYNFKIQDHTSTGVDLQILKANESLLTTRGLSEKERFGGLSSTKNINDLYDIAVKQQQAISSVAQDEFFNIKKGTIYQPYSHEAIQILTPVSDDHYLVPENYPYVLPVGVKPKIGRSEDPM